MENKVINGEPFQGLVVVVNGIPAELNVVGGIRYADEEYLIITDMAILEIDPDEYEIFKLIREDENISIQSLTDENFYSFLADMWVERVEEEENDS